MGIGVPATAAFCVNIIFSLSYKTANSFGSHSFHKMLQFLAVNQNTALWEKFLLPDGLGLDGHNDLWKNFVFNK